MKIQKEKNGMLTHYEFTDINKKLITVHGDKFINYRNEWDFCNKNLIPSKKPLYIVLETNTYCNLKCKMCEKNFYTKDKMDISQEIIEKIVLECKEFALPSILIGAAAESLINPDIKKILSKIKTIGAVDNFVITNGTKLDHSMNEFLIDNKFERLYVSLDAAKQDTYRKIRGADLEVVENNIYDFLKTRKKKKSSFPLLRVSFVKQKENEDEIEAFISKWQDKVDIIDIQEMCDFSNLDELEEFPYVKYKCQAPFTTLSLDCAGNIYPCCTFYRKYLCLGNIKDITLMDAWNSNKIQELRNSIVKGELCKACRNCARRNI